MNAEQVGAVHRTRTDRPIDGEILLAPRSDVLRTGVTSHEGARSELSPTDVRVACGDSPVRYGAIAVKIEEPPRGRR